MARNPGDETIRRLEALAAQGDRHARVRLLHERRRRGLPDPVWRGARKLSRAAGKLTLAAFWEVFGGLEAMFRDELENRDRPDRDDSRPLPLAQALDLVDEVVEQTLEQLSDDGADWWAESYPAAWDLTANRSSAFAEAIYSDLIRRAGRVLKARIRRGRIPR